ncbi:hypothetical protein ACTI_26610 [Actinoplanes sp. OR16]|uniref:hypothetical protein n=1 Tax=Actinoplanes sp. OR16 TaxID=946334 RepID=UPI000F6F69C4|nr:hypothetical protein [Actinoplanes sp. OR16]BBH65976.1 hypothetical protein ACTI_26610 [Actinoplanes sp. OR16]
MPSLLSVNPAQSPQFLDPESRDRLNRSAIVSGCVGSTRRSTLPVAQVVWQHQDTDPEYPHHQEPHMSASKLSRIAGLVLVLASVLGGLAAGPAAAEESAAVIYSTLDFNWD